MKRSIIILGISLVLVALLCTCNKENLIQLEPVGMVKIQITALPNNVSQTQQELHYPYGPKLANNQLNFLPNEFETIVKVKTDDDADKVTKSTTTFQGGLYQLKNSVEVPLNKPFTLVVSAKIDTNYWEGVSDKITIQVGNLPSVISIFMRNKNEIVLTDVDGNKYYTITIGSQVWMQENLKTTKFNDGSSILNVTDNTAWNDNFYTSTSAYCDYDNNPNNRIPYGLLYNYFAVMDSKQLCPTGWHVPTDDEWKSLEMYLGMTQVEVDAYNIWRGTDQGTQLKSLDLSNLTNGTNYSGFTALLGGYRYHTGGFNDINVSAAWWTSTVIDEYLAWSHKVYTGIGGTGRNNDFKHYGFSVRCLKDGTYSVVTTEPIVNYTSTTLNCGGNVITEGKSVVTDRGICWNTLPNPTVSNSKISIGTGKGSFNDVINTLTTNTSYYLKAFATNSAGTAYGNEVNFTTWDVMGTVSDIDGNTYNTIKIGSQVWMAENLKTTLFSDGSSITNITDNTWPTLTTEAYCFYNNDPTTYKNLYGALYNFYAVVDSRNVCPIGWHVPTDNEWTTLINNAGGNSIAGGVLKEVGLAHWSAPNPSYNSKGFTALPGGQCDVGFLDDRGYGFWWSANEYSAVNAGSLEMFFNTTDIATNNSTSKYKGMSVRCIMDDVQSAVTTSPIINVTATTADCGGNVITEGGSAVTARGVCWSTAANPTIADFTTNDGSGFGSYVSSLTGLTSATTYYVRAYSTNGSGTSYGNEVSFTTP